MAVAISLQTGCLTQMTLEKWEGGIPLESSRVEVVSARNDRVVLGWETTTYLGKRTGDIELDPHMPGCEDVHVFISIGNDGRQTALVDAAGDIIFGNDGPQGVLVGAAGDIHPSVLPGPCDVDILVQCLFGELLLKATRPGRPPAYAHIKTPRNHLWLTVVPLAATADVLLAVLRINDSGSQNPFRNPQRPPPPTFPPRFLRH